MQQTFYLTIVSALLVFSFLLGRSLGSHPSWLAAAPTYREGMATKITVGAGWRRS